MTNPHGVRHVFDDIEEHDNRLPNWWLGILWATLFFGLGYWLYYQSFGWGPDSRAEYQAELDEAARNTTPTAPPALAGGGGQAPGAPSAGGALLEGAALLALASDAPTQQKGKEEFGRTCAACHGPEGGGLIGPNLTDKFWLHGSKPEQIRLVISKGITEKGMPAWEPTLGAERVTALTAYVLSLKGKNVPGKPPQGDPEE